MSLGQNLPISLRTAFFPSGCLSLATGALLVCWKLQDYVPVLGTALAHYYLSHLYYYYTYG